MMMLLLARVLINGQVAFYIDFRFREKLQVVTVTLQDPPNIYTEQLSAAQNIQVFKQQTPVSSGAYTPDVLFFPAFVSPFLPCRC